MRKSAATLSTPLSFCPHNTYSCLPFGWCSDLSSPRMTGILAATSRHAWLISFWTFPGTGSRSFLFSPAQGCSIQQRLFARNYICTATLPRHSSPDGPGSRQSAFQISFHSNLLFARIHCGMAHTVEQYVFVRTSMKRAKRAIIICLNLTIQVDNYLGSAKLPTLDEHARKGITKDERMKLNCIGSNQNEVTLGNGTVVLFSYNTPVAAFFEYKYYRTDKKWSRTTSKHINQWLNGVTAEEKPQAWFESLAS